MSWNVNFNKNTAENVYSAVQKNKHLKGFYCAEDKLNDLKNKLENLLFEAEWWGGKCKEAADHYAYMQKQYQDNPNDFSDAHAREVNNKSSQMLYDYVTALSGGASKLRDAINAVTEILTKIKYAEDDAKEESKKVLEKITHAIDLMDSYLRVSF